MELRVKAHLGNASLLEGLVEEIREIEKEHSCNCTLLEVEIA